MVPPSAPVESVIGGLTANITGSSVSGVLNILGKLALPIGVVVKVLTPINTNNSWHEAARATLTTYPGYTKLSPDQKAAAIAAYAVIQNQNKDINAVRSKMEKAIQAIQSQKPANSKGTPVSTIQSIDTNDITQYGYSSSSEGLNRCVYSLIWMRRLISHQKMNPTVALK